MRRTADQERSRTSLDFGLRNPCLSEQQGGPPWHEPAFRLCTFSVLVRFVDPNLGGNSLRHLLELPPFN